MKILDVMSGSHGAVTASHNRFGYYLRKRSSPVQPRTPAQLIVRSRLSSNAAAWRALTAAQRAGWKSLGAMISRTDSLGKTYTLNGFMAYCSVNNNKLAAGDATIPDAPELITPVAPVLGTFTSTGGVTPALSLAFTPTPAGAANRIFVYASSQMSAGRTFTNSYRLLTVTAVNATSPQNLLAAYTAKFGVPVTGNLIALKVALYDGGFISGMAATSAVTG